MKNEQQRVLGRIMASEIQADVLAATQAGGGTDPIADGGAGSGWSSYTAGPTVKIQDTRGFNDWPTA